jgi:putative transposase
MCESFFATLECERIDRRTYRTHADARQDIFQFIEGWYNPHDAHRRPDTGLPAPSAEALNDHLLLTQETNVATTT